MSAAFKQQGYSPQASEDNAWKFADILAEPEVKSRWEKVRQYFFLRESTYDMTSQCNIQCEGCYYYEGEKQHTQDNRNEDDWRTLMQAEKERGVTFVVLAGAEPSLTPSLCHLCYEHIPLGAIATNGLKPIPSSIAYSIHISVWGNDRTSLQVRKARDMLTRQVANYKDDPRAVFIYTFTRKNIQEAREVTEFLAEKGCRVSFNMFSAPVGYRGDLKHTRQSLVQTRQIMLELLDAYPETVLFSPYNAVAHTHVHGLHDLYGCSYPRRNVEGKPGLGRTFRQYRTDLTWDQNAACCVPDTECTDCRHYAAGSAVVTARLFRHAGHPHTFKAWLDYVDTYLAVWVRDYHKSPNLMSTPIPPPGFGIEE